MTNVIDQKQLSEGGLTPPLLLLYNVTDLYKEQ
jgi:hypothetical protein